MSLKVALVLALVFGAGASYAEDDPDKALAAGVVKMSAQFTEMAQACKHMSASELATSKSKQREAALADLEISSSEYDKLYAEVAGDFRKKWASMSAQQQKQSCDQMKNMSKIGN